MSQQQLQQLLPKAGDVLIYRTEFKWWKPMSYLSAAIRGFTQYPYNHAALVVENNKVPFINEALIGGIVARPLEKYLNRKGSLLAVLRPKAGILDPVQFSIEANEYVGNKYDITSLVFHHTVYRIPKLLGFKYFGKWMGSTGKFATSKLVCSEYVGLAYNLPNWWSMSTREVVESGAFDVIYEEKPLLKR